MAKKSKKASAKSSRLSQVSASSRSEMQMPARGKEVDKNVAIIALIINIFLPGVGSLIAGRTKAGLWQVILFGISIVLTLTIIGAIIGIPLYVIAWIWAIVTGATLVRDSI